MMTVIDSEFKGSLSGNIEDYPEGLVFVIDKPYRWTSADVIRKLKYAAIRHFNKKNLKVGHAGTLDPLATGVLLLCIGNACKKAQELQDTDKEYVAGVCFGATTASYDLEKEVESGFSLDGVSPEALSQVLEAMKGAREQVAPLFSAKMVDGVRAYELARKMHRAGEALDAAAEDLLRVNNIVLSELELLRWDETCPAVETEHSRDSGACGTRGQDEDAGQSAVCGNGNGCGTRGQGEDAGQGAACGTGDGCGTRGQGEDAGQGAACGTGNGCGAHGQGEDAGQSAVCGTGEAKGHNPNSRINVATVPAGLPEATIRIACSKGTYIRALARDLGEALGSAAFLTSLQRSASGKFRVEKAISPDHALSILLTE